MAKAATVTTAPAPTGTQAKIQTIIGEQMATHFERNEIIPVTWCALVAHHHHLQIGPGGAGKSFLTRDLASRIEGTNYFEIALDETTTPDQILGAPDIKSLVEEGKVRRVTDGMLPTAHVAFLDEFFNSNGPALHSMMPPLNERIIHNNGKPVPIPLRTAFMGTNKLNADQDQAALWDRVHIRQQVGYVKDRDNLKSLISASVLRNVRSYQRDAFTTITLEELDTAHDEAMSMPINDVAWETFLDLIEELERNGVIVSTRRQAWGMEAVLAHAWLNGHDEAKIGDLAILRHMFWRIQDEISVVKNIVLTATNPGEKKALDLLDDLLELKTEYGTIQSLDELKRQNASIDIVRKANRLIAEAKTPREQAVAAGASTSRLDDLIEQAGTFSIKVTCEAFGVTEEQAAAMAMGTR